MSPEDKERRARQAREVYRHPAFRAALDLLKEDAVEAFMASGLQETGEREILYHRFKGVEALEAVIRNWSSEV